MFGFSSRRFRVSVVIGVAAVLLATSLCASAQSGRKPPKRDPDPPPPPPPTSTHAEAPAREDASRVTISAMKYVPSMNIPSSVASFLLSETARRLDESGVCRVTTGKDLSRKEATDLAKGSTDSLVLWIQLGVDAADEDMSGMGPVNLRNLVETYVLFEPGTGKVRTQGRLYVSADRTNVSHGGVLGPYSGANRGTRGMSPEEAGEKTAHYILDSLAGRSSSGTPSIHP